MNGKCRYEQPSKQQKDKVFCHIFSERFKDENGVCSKKNECEFYKEGEANGKRNV